MLILFLLFQSIYSTLLVYTYGNREQLVNTTNYVIATFGLIPYGKKLQAALYLPPLKNQNDRFCDLQQVNYYDSYFTNQYMKWIIDEDRDCSPTQKAIIAQNIGAQLLILIDDSEGQFLLQDDGNGYQIEIPVIKINRAEGLILFNELQKQLPGGQLSAFIKFDQIDKQQKSKVIFGFDISNRETFRLIITFKEYYDHLKEFVDFNLFYVFYEFKDSDQNMNNDDCINDGRYCQIDIDGNGSGKGSHLVKEQLRQFCLWNYNKQLWWKYMIYFSDSCTKPHLYESCFKFYLTEEIYSKFQDCFTNFPQTEIQILEEQKQLKQQLSVVYVPSISINGKQYRGSLDALNIKNAICESIIGSEKLRICNGEQSFELKQSNTYGLLITFVIIVSILFLLFIRFIYREMLKNQMKQNITQTIEQELNYYSQYY